MYRAEGRAAGFDSERLHELVLGCNGAGISETSHGRLEASRWHEQIEARQVGVVRADDQSLAGSQLGSQGQALDEGGVEAKRPGQSPGGRSADHAGL
jgi:hypothetical protein